MALQPYSLTFEYLFKYVEDKSYTLAEFRDLLNHAAEEIGGERPQAAFVWLFWWCSLKGWVRAAEEKGSWVFYVKLDRVEVAPCLSVHDLLAD